MNSKTITLSLTPAQRKKLFSAWSEYKTDKTPAYAEYQLRPENAVITSYESGKVVFQGKDAEVYASPFMEVKEDIFPQAGSDEVGTGDYLGPMVVCATILDEKTYKKIQNIGIHDSKSLKDEDILKVGKELMKQCPHSLLILEPEKYNEVHQNLNLNAMKAYMHNQAYINLKKRYDLPKFIIIDQFTPENSYYRYLKNEKEIIRNIHFETKAEDKYPSVGCASMIARYAFLKEMDKLEKKWDCKLNKGGGQSADESAKEFVNKHCLENLKYVAKLHFKNTERIK